MRRVNSRMEPYLDDETSEQAAVRLLEAGHTLLNASDLAAFALDYPDELQKWAGVLAISEDSRFAYNYAPDDIEVLCAYVGHNGRQRGLGLRSVRQSLSGCGVLVLCE